MDSFELNKYFGAITGAFALFLGIGFLTEIVYHPSKDKGHGDDHHPKLAFSIPIEEAEEVVEEAEPELSLPELMAAADAGRGEKVFNKCKACHNVDPGGSNGQGPALHGVMGRDIGGHDGFSYSAAMAEFGGVWDWEAMNAFLVKPKEYVDGTKMNFAGLKDADDRANLMAYLNANSDAPLDLPTE